jgi:acetyltransferase EpsM
VKKLIIIGAGGAGIESLFVARRMGGIWDFIGFGDDSQALEGCLVEGLPVVGSVSGVLSRFGGQDMSFHCAVGSNQARKRIAEAFEAEGFSPATLVDPTAVIGGSAAVGAGCYVGPQSYVGPQAVVGRHVIVNVGASVGHNNVIGDFSQVCPGARLTGGTVLGEGVFVGSNAVTVPGSKIGAWSTLGAASLLVRDLPERVMAIGVPAQVRAPAAPPQPSQKT